MKKITAIFATFALLLNLFTPIALAETSTLEISGNGAESESEIEIETENNVTVVQENNATIVNNITSTAKTGGNDANDNTGGDVTMVTGNAVSSVDVNNVANLNKAIVDTCDDCVVDYDVKISGNGYNSENEVDVEHESNVEVFQNNDAYIENNIYSNTKTGGNDANRNTGGDVTIVTGHALSDVSVSNVANANVAFVGGGEGERGSVSAYILNNSAESENEFELELDRSVTLVQDNDAWIYNDIWSGAKTGYNDANDNTGGDVYIDTGMARSLVTVDNLANFNFAFTDCCVFDLTGKISGNGYESENEIDVELDNELYVFQGGEGDGNYLDLDNLIDSYAKTGYNEADRNTGESESDPAIITGHSLSDVEVFNSSNANVFGSADEMPELSFHFDFDEILDYVHHLLS